MARGQGSCRLHPLASTAPERSTSTTPACNGRAVHSIFGKPLTYILSPAAIAEWFEGSELRRYLKLLTDKERPEFLSRYQAALTKAYPAQNEGKVLLRMPRVSSLFNAAERGSRSLHGPRIQEPAAGRDVWSKDPRRSRAGASELVPDTAAGRLLLLEVRRNSRVRKSKSPNHSGRWEMSRQGCGHEPAGRAVAPVERDECSIHHTN